MSDEELAIITNDITPVPIQKVKSQCQSAQKYPNVESASNLKLGTVNSTSRKTKKSIKSQLMEPITGLNLQGKFLETVDL